MGSAEISGISRPTIGIAGQFRTHLLVLAPEGSCNQVHAARLVGFEALAFGLGASAPFGRWAPED